MSDSSAVEAVETRIRHYGDVNAIPPVTPSGFDYLYQSLNSNMRDALAYAQEFSQYLDEECPEGSPLPGVESREDLLRGWMKNRAANAAADARHVQPRHWQFFDDVCERAGRFASSQYAEFNFNAQQQMTAAVSALASANLMVREVDPEDATRTVNSVTALGWLVYSHRRNPDVCLGDTLQVTQLP